MTKFSDRCLGPWISLGAAGLLWGCSGVTVLNAVEPKTGVTVTHDIAYEPGPRGKLDVYQPEGADGHAPVVVFVYGGGWDSGPKADYAFVGDALARRGFVTVIPDYRLYPEVRWPDFLKGNARAWTSTDAAAYGGDARELFLMGHSAGAYDSVTLAVDRRWLGAVGIDPRRDIGASSAWPAPMISCHCAAADKVVDPGNTARMAAQVRAAGGEVETRDYPGLSHAHLVGAIAAPLRFLAPVLADVTRFIRAQAGQPPAEGQP